MVLYMEPLGNKSFLDMCRGCGLRPEYPGIEVGQAGFTGESLINPKGIDKAYWALLLGLNPKPWLCRKLKSRKAMPAPRQRGGAADFIFTRSLEPRSFFGLRVPS